MAKVFTPSFKVTNKVETAFTTNNPTMEDRKSLPVMIVDLSFNEVTRSIEVTCDDKRKRQCRIDRMSDSKMVQTLSKHLQKAYDDQFKVCFVAAGGADPGVWFYNITISI